jgi:hypothetical protein
MAGNVARMGICLKYFSRKIWREETILKNSHRWEDNIRMDVREIRWEDVDWMHLTQDKEKWLVNRNVVKVKVKLSLWVFK